MTVELIWRDRRTGGAAVRRGDAQTVDAVDRRRGHSIVRLMRDDIQREYYDSTFHGLDLAARAAAADARVDQARSLDDIMVSIAQFSLELGDSHTFFLPPSRTVTIAYGWDMLMVGDSCFVTSIQRGSDAEAQGVDPGGLPWTLWQGELDILPAVILAGN